jgi:PDZ domain
MNGTERAPMHERLSRETRHLLVAACIALVALWVLARLRFPDTPATANAIPPLLTQLSQRPAFADLASEVARVQNRLAGTVVALPDREAVESAGQLVVQSRRSGLRIRNDVAVVLLEDLDRQRDRGRPDLIAFDRATGLALARVDGVSPGPSPAPWAADRLDAPRYLVATTLSREGVSFEPVFVGALHPTPIPGWSGPVWLLPVGTHLTTGSFLFTHDGELVGLVSREGSENAIVPGETLLADAERLLERRAMAPGGIGVTAQALTPALSAATGSSTGVIVAWIDPKGPASSQLAIGDIIESVNGSPLGDVRDWEVRTSRLSAGETLDLGVRQRGTARAVKLVATALPAQGASRSLGLTLKWSASVGSEVLSVDRGSAADAAGIVAGDVITSIGTVTMPAPAQIRRAYASAGDAESLLVAVTRGNDHALVALVK